MDSTDSGKSDAQPATGTSAPDESAWTLPDAMTGRASPAKAAVGDKPVFAYLASLPQPQRGIAEAVDALAATTLPNLQRSVKWGMAYYGVGDGWCFSSGGFAGHVKLMFINGAALEPVPPVTPVGMGKSTRGVELASVDDLDERQIAAWMTQVTSVPGLGGKKTHIPSPDEPSVPELEADQTIAPRPEEEIADALRAEPDLEDHSEHRVKTPPVSGAE
ncbi:hypothetical protein RCH12_001395 [Cryobacterium sp. MP_3.1]|uniref:DUF1801 domain-containing protein n=1 Tax=Cryobacterium sp. MP_3.1 TaxID=3071711 RepID=UPI002DFD1BE4|nr:hypothetical protein [Cryobacterium sp. MP_3.1]